MDGPIRTHNVGGLLGKLYREELGDEVCRRVNRILMVYNVPRYPGIVEPEPGMVVSDIEFVKDFVSNEVERILSR